MDNTSVQQVFKPSYKVALPKWSVIMCGGLLEMDWKSGTGGEHRTTEHGVLVERARKFSYTLHRHTHKHTRAHTHPFHSFSPVTFEETL